jgi:NADH-quinone oxidoreductase subunit D
MLKFGKVYKHYQTSFSKIPEGPYHADVPDYYLPPKEDVYHNMESLIYHFKIVMGEVPVPVAEIYHAVEGGNGELGFYLVTDGSRTPYRLHFRRPCFIYYQAYPEMIKGALLSDAIVILSSLNVIAGELDAYIIELKNDGKLTKMEHTHYKQEINITECIDESHQ